MDDMLLQISGQEWRYYALRFGRLIIAEIETKAGEGSAIFTVGDGEQETREIVERYANFQHTDLRGADFQDANTIDAIMLIRITPND